MREKKTLHTSVVPSAKASGPKLERILYKQHQFTKNGSQNYMQYNRHKQLIKQNYTMHVATEHA